ncbi:DUF7344 domain-containing protein [Natrinema marinum]|uniref:DUF7344 domain-containing protein n=1 Tax=Natrinema marinum TaxID=2961598 RepID=UPI0020C835EA|nr:hypothetical protein [Natrinema marinum]
MNNSASSGPTADARDERFSALADSRRRTVVRLVSERAPRAVEKEDLAFQLAAVIDDKRLAAVTENDRKQALVDLHHHHLPRLTDVGLLEQTDDGAIALADHRAVDEPRLEDAISADRTEDAAELDALFEALADERRRTVLSVLGDQYHPIATETLARDVAAREAGTTERAVSDDRVHEVHTSLVHVHLPVLHEATLVSYDASAGQAAYEGHPAVRAEWLRSADGSTVTNGETAASIEDEAPVRTLEGRETIVTTGQSLCEGTENELFLLFTTTGLLEEACFRRIEDAVDRGVDVYLGSSDPRVRELVRERVPGVTVWEPQRDWFDLPAAGDSVGRLVFADREAVMLGAIGRPSSGDDRPAETAIVGKGSQNGLVVLLRQLLGSRLERLDGRRDDAHVPFSL